MRMPRLLAATLVAATVVVVAPPRPAGATFPGADGRIAFSRNGDVYTARVGPTYSEKRLTYNGTSGNPRWSPDGTRITYDSGGNIVVMAGDGTSKRVVVRGGAGQPAWSPRTASGQGLVFVRTPPGGGPADVWVVGVDGTGPKRLTHDGSVACGDSSPAWSSTGRYITYYLKKKDPDIGCSGGPEFLRVVVVDLRTGVRRVVPFEAPDTDTFDYLSNPRPDFTADGTKVQYVGKTYACSWYVMQYDVRTTQQTIIRDGYECEGGSLMHYMLPTPSAGQAESWEGWNGESPPRLVVGGYTHLSPDGVPVVDVQPVSLASS